MADENPSEPPASKPFKILSQILSARGFILGTAAIITAAASWFKPSDTTATKATYEVLAIRINELSKDTETNHNDLQALIRAYLIEKTPVAPVATTGPGPQLPLAPSVTLTPLVRKKVTPPVPDYFARSLDISPAPPEISKGGSLDMGAGVEPPKVVTLPAAPREPASELPPFDQVVQQAAKKK